jgi:hypothetical protein
MLNSNADTINYNSPIEYKITLDKLREAREAYESYIEARLNFFNYLSSHTEKALWEYKTNLNTIDGDRDLDTLCDLYITGDALIEDQYKALEYSIKDAIQIKDAAYYV